jgi:hypothetical protein
LNKKECQLKKEVFDWKEPLIEFYAEITSEYKREASNVETTFSSFFLCAPQFHSET